MLENGVTHTDKQHIANKFNQFFTNIAQTLARGIKYDGTTNLRYCLNKHINTVFNFENIDEEKRLGRQYKPFPKKTLDFKLLLETCEIDLFSYPTLTKRPAEIALLGCE